MLMVVFGAGASFDSSPTYQPRPPVAVSTYPPTFVPTPTTQEMNESRFRPPLADELFQNRPNFEEKVRAYRQMSGIISDLRHREGKTVEQCLQDFQIESKEHPHRRSQLAAVRYYLRDVLAECTRGWLNVM